MESLVLWPQHSHRKGNFHKYFTVTTLHLQYNLVDIFLKLSE